MRPVNIIGILFAAAIASVGSAQAQTVFIEDDAVAPVVTPPVLATVPAVTPGVVIVRRRPVVAAAPLVVAPRRPIIAAEPVVIAPAGCYGYGYC